jgi:predicted ATP-binding protein involved in virulence
MRLDHLHLQNFRCYEDAHFDFQPGFNLVVGVNGSGKTSLLQGIVSSIAPYLTVVGGFSNFVMQTEDQVRFVVDQYEGRIRFERRYPVKLEGKGELFNSADWLVIKERRDQQSSTIGPTYNTVIATMTKLDSGTEIELPMLAFYQASRRWMTSGLSAELAVTQRVSRLDGYANWSDAALNLKDFESWFIGKTLERLEAIGNSKSAVDNFDDELAWANSAIRRALPESMGVRYDLKLRSLMVDLSAEKSLPFSHLSDGQRGMVALIADIARRMCILNPHIGRDVLANTSGVVIIDELDIHLHPAWQRTIVSALKNAFPKVQFIAASHSPQIIGSLKPEEVIILNNSEGSHPRITYGLDSSSVLEEVMGVAQREPEIERLLSEMFSALEDNDLKQAKLLLKNLKKMAPDLPEFAGAEALIKRKEIIGR